MKVATKRSKDEVQRELDQLNRNISWTFGRAGVEGTNPSRELTDTLIARVHALEAELKDSEETHG